MIPENANFKSHIIGERKETQLDSEFMEGLWLWVWSPSWVDGQSRASTSYVQLGQVTGFTSPACTMHMLNNGCVVMVLVLDSETWWLRNNLRGSEMLRRWSSLVKCSANKLCRFFFLFFFVLDKWLAVFTIYFEHLRLRRFINLLNKSSCVVKCMTDCHCSGAFLIFFLLYSNQRNQIKAGTKDSLNLFLCWRAVFIITLKAYMTIMVTDGLKVCQFINLNRTDIAPTIWYNYM